MSRAAFLLVFLLGGLGRAQADDETGERGESAKLACVHRHEEAQVARRSGKLLAARAALLACSREVCPDAVRGDCVDWLEDVNRSVPSVVVAARDRGLDVAEVQVFLDGELVATRLTGSALEADPGEHHFRFVLARGPVVERTVLMSEGMRNRPIEVEFAPPPPPLTAALPAPAPPPPPPPWTFANHPLKQSDYVCAGVALVGLATTAALGIWAIREHGDLARSCGPTCTDAETAPLTDKLVIADVALGAAVVALAVGAYRYFKRAPVSGTVTVGRTF